MSVGGIARCQRGPSLTSPFAGTLADLDVARRRAVTSLAREVLLGPSRL